MSDDIVGDELTANSIKVNRLNCKEEDDEKLTHEINEKFAKQAQERDAQTGE